MTSRKRKVKRSIRRSAKKRSRSMKKTPLKSPDIVSNLIGEKAIQSRRKLNNWSDKETY